MGGYVGNAHDKQRIERQLKEREEQRKQVEEAKKKAQSGAGLREFGAATSEVRARERAVAAGGRAGGPTRLCTPRRRPSSKPSRTKRWAW